MTSASDSNASVLAEADSVADTALANAIQRHTSDWQQWNTTMSKRNGNPPLRKLLSRNALFWGCPTRRIIHQPSTVRLLELKKNQSSAGENGIDWAEACEEWMQGAAAPQLDWAIEALAWGHACPYLAKQLTQKQWRDLVLKLSSLATSPLTDEAPAWHFLTYVELPLTLAYALPEIPELHAMRKLARERFGQRLEQLLDGEGMPAAEHIDQILLLLASATRCLVMDETIKKGHIKKSARAQYDWLCRQTLRWSRPNGSSILSPEHDDGPFYGELLKTALRLTGDESDQVAYKTLQGKRKPKIYDDVPDPAERSEWSQLAVLRTDWSPQASYVGVTYRQRSLHLELASAGGVLMRGAATPRLWIDGQHQPLSTDWEEVCWEADEDMDYLELEAKFSSRWKIQRQILLAREDNFLFLADAILPADEAASADADSAPDSEQLAAPESGPAELRYQMPLPLVQDVELEQPDENTEAHILAERRAGTVVPLSFPEWKSQQFQQRLRLDPARLEIQRTGRALYAPLFIDLDPVRCREPLTWRRLCVAEKLETVGEDVAVAFRVQIAKQQWLFYRALECPGNRTFLGQNLTAEFLAAKFTTDGEAETLVSIEG